MDEQKNEIRIYKDPVRSVAIASKPHVIAEILKDEVLNHPIAKAICSDIPIRSYEYIDYENSIKALVIRLVLDFGSKMKTDDIIVFTGRLVEFISRKYHFLTIKEVSMAFEDGTTGEDADKIFLNFKTVASFLSKYAKNRRDYIATRNTQADISRINRDWKSREYEINGLIDDVVKSNKSEDEQ